MQTGVHVHCSPRKGLASANRSLDEQQPVTRPYPCMSSLDEELNVGIQQDDKTVAREIKSEDRPAEPQGN